MSISFLSPQSRCYEELRRLSRHQKLARSNTELRKIEEITVFAKITKFKW